MNIEEAKQFCRENIDRVFIHRNFRWNNEETLVRLVGWSCAFRGVYLIVSVDQRVARTYIPSFDYKHKKDKDNFLSQRTLENKRFWYISKKEYLTLYKNNE